MNNYPENGETPKGQYRANPVLESVTTMSIDKKQLTKLLSYMSTFDGGIYRPSNGGNCQFIMNMREDNRDYIEWVKTTLENLTSTRLNSRKDYSTDGCERSPQLRLESNRHPFLTTLRERLYIDNHKVIDPHMLKLMDEEALAIIFMCDGGTSLDKRFKNPHCSITLNTKGFSHADNLSLSKAIYEKTGVRTNIRKHNSYYYLGVKTEDVISFVEKVFPYMLPSFYYKLERIAPALKHKQGGDIVCSLWEHKDLGRNDQGPLIKG